jgi:hypothetical protein
MDMTEKLTPKASTEMMAMAARLLASADELAEVGADAKSIATMVDEAGKQLRAAAKLIRRGE